jgi:APA family basic amino acid/polyamine antiporter
MEKPRHKLAGTDRNWNTPPACARESLNRPSPHRADIPMSVQTTPDDLSGSRAATADSRLLRAVGMWALVAGIVNVTIGGGIFRLPGGVYKTLGTASPLAYLVCAVLMALIVVCFAEAGSRVSLTGGLYAYIEVAFGPLVGFVAGVLLWAGMTSAIAAVAVFLGDAIQALIPALSGGTSHAVIVTVILVLLAGLNVVGVANATRFNTVMTVAKLAPLAIVIVAGFLSLRGDRLAIAAAPPLADLAGGSILLMFAFLGIESALVPSGEVKDPARTVPRAIAIAIGLVVIVYISIQLVAQSALGPALAESKTPVADAAGVLLGPWGRTLILGGSALSMLGYVSGMTLAVPRMVYAFGRDGFLFSRLGSVHSRFRTPHVAIGVQTAITVIVATTGTFEQLGVVSAGALLLVYGACALAVFELRRRNVRTESEPFQAPLGGLVPALALVAIVWLLTSLDATQWLAIAGTVVAALAIFAATARTRRASSR